MNRIIGKLRSKAGESMILAMVFMLFCVFVGGSVLASATANAYRVEHLSDQQDYLSQRSAAKLISDELKGTSNSRLRLSIADVDLVAQEVYVDDGGAVIPTATPAHKVRTITFKAPSGLVMTPFQRVLFESAVVQYLNENNITPTDMPDGRNDEVVVELEGFQYLGTDGEGNPAVINITSVTQFWLKDTTANELLTKGEVSITGSSNLDIAQIPAYFESCEGERLYDFAVTFGDYSQMSLTMIASYGERNPVELTKITDYSYGSTVSYAAAEVTTKTRQPIISWDLPLIEKGGV